MHTHTRRTLYKDEGRDQGDAETKECQHLPANHQEPGQRHETDFPSQPWERTNPVAMIF